MEKRDYIESMIEQMGLFLKRLLSDLIKDVGTDNIDKKIDSIEELFTNEFNLSIEKLVKLPDSEFKNFFINHKFRETHLENLSELLYQISLQKVKIENDAEILKERAIQLLDLADLVSNSYSIERINKKNKISKSEK